MTSRWEQIEPVSYVPVVEPEQPQMTRYYLGDDGLPHVVEEAGEAFYASFHQPLLHPDGSHLAHWEMDA